MFNVALALTTTPKFARFLMRYRPSYRHQVYGEGMMNDPGHAHGCEGPPGVGLSHLVAPKKTWCPQAADISWPNVGLHVRPSGRRSLGRLMLHASGLRIPGQPLGRVVR